MMHQERSKISSRIIEAFSGVKRNSGTTLHEALARDNRLSDEEIRSERKKDLDLDWTEIDRKDLGCKFDSVLSFLDADGFRYYIPVFMIASLEGEADFPFFHLTNFSGVSLRKSTPEMFVEKYKFDKKQCEAISNFLRFVCDFMQYGTAEQEAVQRWENYVENCV